MVDLLTREYEVNYSHIDNRGIAKPSFLWNIMQDAATVHGCRMSGCGAKRGVRALKVQAGTAVSRSLWITSRSATHSLCG